jgi:AcrR family transcriptional regulator
MARQYRSALRDEQARLTRNAVVEAARDLFIERGYTGTTIEGVAERAGVSRKTVFTTVGGKAALLRVAWDWVLAGDDQPIAMADRPALREVLDQTDRKLLVASWARSVCEIAARLAPLYEVLRMAAQTDPDVAEVHATSERNRLGGARSFVQHLDEVGGLRPDLHLDRATEVVAVLMDPMPYQRLVEDADWAMEDYAALIARMAGAALLRE